MATPKTTPKPRRGNKPLSARLLMLVGRLLPGDKARTWCYLTLIAKPRKLARSLLFDFYRYDHVYEVLGEARKRYAGDFSILEFGSADGYSLTKMLYATRYTGMAERVTVHGFDTFEGMPEPEDEHDRDQVTGDGWVKGQFKGRYEHLDDYCSQKYGNHQLHRGMFDETLTPEFLESLKQRPPILVWIDCDYYSSTRCVFERLLPHLPSGCVLYFDDVDFNYGSPLTGEMQAIQELNAGGFGPGMSLVPDLGLSLFSRRVYRFVTTEPRVRYEPLARSNDASHVRQRTNDSPLP